MFFRFIILYLIYIISNLKRNQRFFLYFLRISKILNLNLKIKNLLSKKKK